MAPLPPLLSDAKDTWEAVKDIMDWFSKIVTTSYEYSDAIIASRQLDVDKAFARRKAEQNAKQVMLEQLRNRTASPGAAKVKRNVVWDEEGFGF